MQKSRTKHTNGLKIVGYFSTITNKRYKTRSAMKAAETRVLNYRNELNLSKKLDKLKTKFNKPIV